jgi:hypothetical protein
MSLPLATTLVDMETRVSFVRGSSPFYGLGSNDDYYWGTTAPCNVTYRKNEMPLGKATGAGTWNAGFLFRSVDMVRLSTIGEAHMQLVSYRGYSAVLKLRIYGVATGTSIITPATYAQVTALTRTLAYVDWTIPDAWTDSQQVVTPNIATIVQELVNRKDWKRNNNIHILIVDNGSPVDDLRWIISMRKSAGALKPELHIGFTEP